METENRQNGNGVPKKASRNETAIHKVDGIDPNYLQKYVTADTSLDNLKEHRVVPRLKIVQATSDTELKKSFGEGTVIVRPGDAMICKYQDEPKSFNFVPLFFFVEWAKWADIRVSSGPMILDRSHDPTSELAIKAKDFTKRNELYQGHDKLPENERHSYRYVEHLRFIGIIYGDHPLVGTPVTLSFERGEWGQGKNFISAVTLRRQVIEGTPQAIPLWAQVWTLMPKFREPDASRKWYGFGFEPAEQSIILQDEAEPMLAMHKEFKELFEQQRLMVQDEPTEPIIDEAAVKANKEF